MRACVNAGVCVCMHTYESVCISKIMINLNKKEKHIEDLLGSLVAFPLRKSRSGVNSAELGVGTLTPAS